MISPKLFNLIKNKKLETDQLKNINSQINANRVKSSKETSTILKEKNK